MSCSYQVDIDFLNSIISDENIDHQRGGGQYLNMFLTTFQRGCKITPEPRTSTSILNIPTEILSKILYEAVVQINDDDDHTFANVMLICKTMHEKKKEIVMNCLPQLDDETFLKGYIHSIIQIIRSIKNVVYLPTICLSLKNASSGYTIDTVDINMNIQNTLNANILYISSNTILNVEADEADTNLIDTIYKHILVQKKYISDNRVCTQNDIWMLNIGLIYRKIGIIQEFIYRYCNTTFEEHFDAFMNVMNELMVKKQQLVKKQQYGNYQSAIVKYIALKRNSTMYFFSDTSRDMGGRFKIEGQNFIRVKPRFIYQSEIQTTGGTQNRRRILHLITIAEGRVK